MANTNWLIVIVLFPIKNNADVCPFITASFRLQATRKSWTFLSRQFCIKIHSLLVIDRTSALSETSRTEFSAILCQKVRPKFGRTFRKFYADSVEYKIISVGQPSQKLGCISFYQYEWKIFAFTYII